jgi:hypothetical protein
MIRRFMRLEPLISHTGIIDDVLSINNSRFAEFLSLIYPPELEVKETTGTASSHHFWTYTSNLTTVVNSVLKFMISGTTSILKS